MLLECHLQWPILVPQGDPLVDLQENIAAEAKAQATYEHLMDLTDDPDVLEPLAYLRQREVVHLARFQELHDYYKTNLNQGIRLKVLLSKTFFK